MDYNKAVNVLLARRSMSRLDLARKLGLVPAMITYLCNKPSSFERRKNDILNAIGADEAELNEELKR